MKNRKTLSVVVLFFIVLGSFPIMQIVNATNAPEIEWERIYNTVYQEDRGLYIEQTKDGGYIVISKYNLYKYNSTGIEEWNKTFYKSTYDELKYVHQLSDGGYIISGTKYEGPGVVWLIRTNHMGIEQWNKTYDEGPGWSSCGNTVQVTNDGGYIIIGYGYGGSNTQRPLLIKTDALGNKIWSRQPKSIDFRDGIIGQQTKDNGYIIAGTYNLYPETAIALIKTDDFGYTIWEKEIEGSRSDVGLFVQQTTDGGYIIIGSTGLTPSNGMDIWLVKTDANGNKTWNKTYGGKDSDGGYFVQQTLDGGYILTAMYVDPYGKYYPWIIKTDRNGNKQWENKFPDITDTVLLVVKQTTDKGYIFCGQGRSNTILIKMKPDASLPDQPGDENGEQQQSDINNSGSKDTPGFEIVFALCAIGVAMFLWRKKRIV
jgi:hypothetical protein